MREREREKEKEKKERERERQISERERKKCERERNEKATRSPEKCQIITQPLNWKDKIREKQKRKDNMF